MNDEADLYETDAAYVEAWERWAVGARFGRTKRDPETRKFDVSRGYVFDIQAHPVVEIDQ